MDEDTSASTAVADSSVDAPAPAEGTTDAVDTSTVNDSASTTPEASNDGQPDAPPQTPDQDTPDHGVNPDKGIDPDAGDEVTDTAEPTKGMTRAERAAYYQEVEQQNREQITQAVTAVYQPQDVNQLASYYRTNGVVDQETGETYYPTAGEALMLARDDVREQEKQIAAASTQITQLNANLQVDAVEARAKYDWMNPEKEGKGFSPTTTKATAQLYELATVKDERSGQIVDAKLSPSQIADIVDGIRQEAIKEASINAQRNAERQMAAVAPSTSTTQTRDTPFSELSLAEKKAKLQAQGIYVT